MTKKTIEFTSREIKMLTHIVSRSKPASELIFKEPSELSEAESIFMGLYERLLTETEELKA